MPIEFDFSPMYRTAGCCQSTAAQFPTIKKIDDASEQLEPGMLEQLRPGMKLIQVNEDTPDHKPLSELPVRSLLKLLNDPSKKLTLRFEAVKVVHKVEDWATSQVMCALLRSSLAQYLLD